MIFTESKEVIGSQYPEHIIENSWVSREPLLSPELLRARYLFGIPLVSNLADPLTGKRQVMTDYLLKDFIERAIPEVELDIGIQIMPATLSEKYPFDRNLFESFGYLQLEHRPIASIDQLSIRPANGQDIYTFPKDYVEVSGLQRGQLNIVPIGATIGQSSALNIGGSGIGYLLAMAGTRNWIPAWWNVIYTVGFKDGLMPKIINEIIGTYAAIEILGSLGATYANNNSHSLSLDGASESISGPGAQIYAQRLQDLEAKRVKTVKKLRVILGLSLFSQHV